MIHVPNRLPGDNPLVMYINKLRDAVAMLVPCQSPDMEIVHTTSGVIYKPKIARGAASVSDLTFRGSWTNGETYTRGDLVVAYEVADVMGNEHYFGLWYYNSDTPGGGDVAPTTLTDFGTSLEITIQHAEFNSGSWRLLAGSRALSNLGGLRFSGQITVKDSSNTDRVMNFTAGLLANIDGSTSGDFP